MLKTHTPPIESLWDNLCASPLAAFPTNTHSLLDGSERVKAEERQCLFTFNICAPAMCLTTLAGKGLLHPGVYSKTAAEIRAAASGPRTSAPAGKHSFKCTALPSPFRKLWRLIQKQLEVISINGICTQRQCLLSFHIKPSAVDIMPSLSTSLSCPSDRSRKQRMWIHRRKASLQWHDGEEEQVSR